MAVKGIKDDFLKKALRMAVLCVLMFVVLGSCGSKQLTAEQEMAASDVSYEEEKEIEIEEIVDDFPTKEVKADHSECRLDSLEQTEEGSGIAVYDTVIHKFILDLPEITDGAPLVVMLHGYGESAENMRQKTSFEKEANPKGYAVVYVTGAPTPEDRTSANGWNSGIGISSNDDVNFLCALVNDLCEKYSFDKNRVYAVGFSNGAFMTHRLAVEADDIFAAIVSVAGMMSEKVWSDKPQKCEIGVLQITGEKDDVVPKNSDGSAKYSKAPAIEEVLNYYIEMNDMTLSETVGIGKNATLEKYVSSGSNKQLWNIFIPNGHHSWPDETIVGFNVNQIIMEFFLSMQNKN